MTQQMSENLVWSQIVARAWSDQAFMNRLRSEPRQVLAEHGLEVPQYLRIEVVEGEEVAVDDVDAVRRFTFPASPPGDLAEEDLSVAPAAFCFCGACAACAACGRCACRCACRCW